MRRSNPLSAVSAASSGRSSVRASRSGRAANTREIHRAAQREHFGNRLAQHQRQRREDERRQTAHSADDAVKKTGQQRGRDHRREVVGGQHQREQAIAVLQNLAEHAASRPPLSVSAWIFASSAETSAISLAAEKRLQQDARDDGERDADADDASSAQPHLLDGGAAHALDDGLEIAESSPIRRRAEPGAACAKSGC